MSLPSWPPKHPGQQHHFLKSAEPEVHHCLVSLCGLVPGTAWHTQSSPSKFKAKCLKPAHPPDKTEDPLFHLAQVGTPGNFPALQGSSGTDPCSLLTLLPAASKKAQPRGRKWFFPKGWPALPVPQKTSLTAAARTPRLGVLPLLSCCPTWSLGRRSRFCPIYPGMP